MASAEAFTTIAPSVPRSVAWLQDRTIAQADGVTARDYALLEALLALTALSTKTETEASIEAARLCTVERALTVLSVGGSPAQPRELVASLARLFGRKPEPLKKGASFSFHVPAWTVPLQQPGTRYAHLDLSALARFRRRSSPLLYRDILAHIASEKLRYEPGAKPFELAYVPEQLADALGMPAPVHVGQLRLRYLDPAFEEIREHVRSFEIVDVAVRHGVRRRAGELVRDEAGETIEGRAVEAIVLTIRLLPPERLDAAAARAIREEDFSFIRERGDAPPYAIRPETLVRLGSVLPSKLVGRKRRGGSSPLLASEMRTRHLVWLAAIHEALTGQAITPAFATAPLRGQRLLDAIERDGADKTFWTFSLAEVEAPDLGRAVADSTKLRLSVEAARKARHAEARKAAAKAKRQAVRDARAAGTMPPPVPKRESPDSREKPVLNRPAQPHERQAPQPVPPAQDAVAEAMSILSTPEAKKEADALGWQWQPALDFPRSYAAATLRRFVTKEFEERFPLLRRADALLGEPYMTSLRLLSCVVGFRKENWGAPGLPQPDPYVDEDLLADAVLTLAKSYPLAVENARLDDRPAIEARNRARIVAAGDKARKSWRDREETKRKVARAARPTADPFKRVSPPTLVPVRKNALGVYEAVDE